VTGEVPVTGEVTEPAPVDEPAAYFRGASVAFDRRQAIRVMLGLWLGLLALLLVVLSVTAVSDTSRRSGLVRSGVPVTVRVTSCLAVASGTGETVSGAMCQGTYTLDGRTQAGLVHGMPGTLPAGATVAALVDPTHPSTLSTARSVAAARSSWEAFIPAGITALIMLVSLGAIFGRGRRRARRDGQSARWWRRAPSLTA
jgi:Protein of unknown function (DUF3592)